MKRWNAQNMLDLGRKLFNKIHNRKKLAHHNHNIHLMAREIDDWLPSGIESLIDGSYNPDFLQRIYFHDGVVDQLRLSDRILQNVLLNQIKLTFSHIINPNCFHVLHGPRGVHLATQRIRKILNDDKPNFFIRVDVKSFYSSISHHKLVQDIKKYYDDPDLIGMLERIITNPIETPKGYQNPVTGIALRGPLGESADGTSPSASS